MLSEKSKLILQNKQQRKETEHLSPPVKEEQARSSLQPKSRKRLSSSFKSPEKPRKTAIGAPNLSPGRVKKVVEEAKPESLLTKKSKQYLERKFAREFSQALEDLKISTEISK